ncbi:carboxypeptidase-like regulatory domain-containing protein [Glutamicibacter protophormiae]|uniref:carboxypeptidase-like regulatory domain-containing protein n=1 Tax=Glutamicibacter protophormiae TaxID=37930 RepID=UPI00332EF594
MSTSPEAVHGTDRRTVVKGVAWSAPVIAMAIAAPSAAASEVVESHVLNFAQGARNPAVGSAFEDLAGSVKTSQGQPVGGVQVSVTASSNVSLGQSSLITNGDGSFSVSGARRTGAGTATITVTYTYTPAGATDPVTLTQTLTIEDRVVFSLVYSLTPDDNLDDGFNPDPTPPPYPTGMTSGIGQDAEVDDFFFHLFLTEGVSEFGATLAKRKAVQLSVTSGNARWGDSITGKTTKVGYIDKNGGRVSSDAAPTSLFRTGPGAIVVEATHEYQSLGKTEIARASVTITDAADISVNNRYGGLLGAWNGFTVRASGNVPSGVAQLRLIGGGLLTLNVGGHPFQDDGGLLGLSVLSGRDLLIPLKAMQKDKSYALVWKGLGVNVATRFELKLEAVGDLDPYNAIKGNDSVAVSCLASIPGVLSVCAPI